MNSVPPSSTQTEKVTPKRLPLFATVFYVLGGISLILTAAFLLSKSFSDFFNRTISSWIRTVLGTITSPIPFSLGEFTLLMLIPTVIVLTVFAIRRYADSWHSVFVFSMTLLSVGALIFSIFTLSFAPAYRGTTLDRKLGIDRREVSAKELEDTAALLADHVNLLAEQLLFENEGFSVMPYGLEEMNDRLQEAYAVSTKKYDFLHHFNSRVKPVMLSEAMSYTHITGVYSFYTGEANINVAFPDYTIPYTAAHELAHQRGIAREDEANFVAFLVCRESTDPYIRYSAYLSLYEYVASALYSADPTAYSRVAEGLNLSTRMELRAMSDFSKKYEKSVAGAVSGAVNNTFLTLQGTEGTRSYGMVVDLAVAYYQDGTQNP